MKSCVALMIVVVVCVLLNEVSSQCGCCRRRGYCYCRASCYATTVSQPRICSSTCADVSNTCSKLTTVCNSTIYYSIMLATCPCTCGFCNATTVATLTGVCAGQAVGNQIGPCLACATGLSCINSQCINSTTGAASGPCLNCGTGATCVSGSCTCLG